jgi:hypothetical protein
MNEGAVAQLGERLPCTQEVRSSILLGSTTSLINLSPKFDVNSLFAVKKVSLEN